MVYFSAIDLDGTSFVNLHEPIRLTCHATGGTRAPTIIEWFFNGHKIRTRDPRWDSRLHISDTVPDVPGRTLISKLTIYRSQFSDKGIYICRSLVENDFETERMDVSVLNSKYE